MLAAKAEAFSLEVVDLVASHTPSSLSDVPSAVLFVPFRGCWDSGLFLAACPAAAAASAAAAAVSGMNSQAEDRTGKEEEGMRKMAARTFG